MPISLNDVQRGYDRWAAKPHNAKWVRKIDGTPIANDIVVNIFDELRDSATAEPSKPVAEAVKVKPLCTIKPLEWQGIHALSIVGEYSIGAIGGEWKAYRNERQIASGLSLTHDGALVEAKEAACADYEQRVMSALSTPHRPIFADRHNDKTGECEMVDAEPEMVAALRRKVAEAQSRRISDIPLIASLQRHVDEIGHTEVGQDISAAIDVIRALSTPPQPEAQGDNEALKPCGIADPSTRDCPNMKEVGGGMDGERYRCAVCGKGYYLDYEEMK